MKTSLVVTVLNEERDIIGLIRSISEQSVLPTEVIFVDGGSTDATLSKVKLGQKQFRNLRIIIKKICGNRSVGRNFGVKIAHNEIILFTDAGCTLDRNWVREIVKPFRVKAVDVVAGFYKADIKTVFQKALAPYVLVMPDQVDEKSFLPAARSMAIRKSVWQDTGGFDERLSHNEDFVFAVKLRTKHKNIVFVKRALVGWIPRNNFKDAYRMFRRFAYGDIESGVIRPKVVLIFVRYSIVFMLILLWILSKDVRLILCLLFFFGIYVVWAIWKNYKYVKIWQALYLLPSLQFVSDIAVLVGSSHALLKKYEL